LVFYDNVFFLIFDTIPSNGYLPIITLLKLQEKKNVGCTIHLYGQQNQQTELNGKMGFSVAQGGLKHLVVVYEHK